jgi:hypothetical protein
MWAVVITWRPTVCKLFHTSTINFLPQGHHGRDHMVIGFTTTYATSAYNHKSCEFESRSWRGVLNTTLCDKDKVWQWLATGWWFSPGPLVSSTNKTDRHDITEILLKVALNTIPLTHLFHTSTITSSTSFLLFTYA